MPIYGYRCPSCQREFEVLQRMSDPSRGACPDCGGAGTRLFYPAGILFKGSGFYKTDSRNGAAPASTAAGDGAAPSPEAKPGTKKGDGASAAPASPAPAGPAATPAPAPAAASATD